LDGALMEVEAIWDRLRESKRKTGRWREEAQRAYRMTAGDQYSEEDMQAAAMDRPLIVFNRVGPVVDSIVGMEVASRNEIRFVPTERSDGKINELLTTAVEWVTDRANAEFYISKVFRDCVISGLGVLSVSMDYSKDPDGEIVIRREDPLTFYWDCDANSPNAVDRRWSAIVKLVPMDELEAEYGLKREDLAIDAAIWSEFLDVDTIPHNADLTVAYQQGPGSRAPDDRIPTVEFCYVEREPFYRVALPAGLQEISYGEFRDIKAQLDEMGIRYTRQTRKVWFRKILVGNQIVEEGKAPCPDHCCHQMLTGKRDDKVNGWYGVVRPMVGMPDVQGPQQLVNKLFSEAVNSISTNSKGGLMAEADAFEDAREAEDQWASADQIIWMRPGGLQKVQPKPLGEYPAGMDRLMNWATQAVPEVTGVNWELLGMVQRNQPGIVEDSRRQSAMTILAEYFDALRLMRVELGRILAYMISEYMAGDDPQTSRILRIAGAGYEQYVPLLKDKLLTKYDVVVDEAPTANQKERTWKVLIEMLPLALQMGMPPPSDWIQFAPIPETLIESWLQSMQQAQQAAQNRPDPTQKLIDAEAQYKTSQAQLNAAKTQESAAKASQIMQETQLAPAELQIRTFQPQIPQQPEGVQ
jgi:hypothetical protein